MKKKEKIIEISPEDLIGFVLAGEYTNYIRKLNEERDEFNKWDVDKIVYVISDELSNDNFDLYSIIKRLEGNN